MATNRRITQGAPVARVVPMGPRPKLGLALAGGGFRASLFHLGVLHRMAELDLLRRVEVLSTVSGGSIVGMLYYLKLKQRMEQVPGGDLGRKDYVDLVHDVHGTLVRAIRLDLRDRLFLNPAAQLEVVLSGATLSGRMTRLYERYLYRDVVDALDAASARKRHGRPGFLPLSELRIRPPGGGPGPEGLDAFNEGRLEAGRSCIPRLIVNATTLNSGGRFWFSAAECGDWYLGYTRQDEVEEVMRWKRLLERRGLHGAPAGQARAGEPDGLDLEAPQLVRWFLGRRADDGEGPPLEGWAPLQDLPGFPGVLAAAEVGALRRAKIQAWYLRRWRSQARSGEADRALAGEAKARWAGLLRALELIDEPLAAVVREREAEDGGDGALANRLIDFIHCLYMARTAVALSATVASRWEELGIGDAVGASACFPPVFAPYLIKGIYDEGHVGRLGLTDGGVHDNMGLTALRDEGCTEVIASDTGGVFTIKSRASMGRLGMTARLGDVMAVSLARSQRLYLRERRRSCAAMDSLVSGAPEDHPARDFHHGRALEKLAFFHIESSEAQPLFRKHGSAGRFQEVPPLKLSVGGKALARLRTDLDVFGDVEVSALVNRGYDLADRYLRGYELTEREGLPAPALPPPSAPCPEVTGNRVDTVVRVGRHRLWRSLRLGDLWTRVAFLLAVAGLEVGLLLAGPWLWQHRSAFLTGPGLWAALTGGWSWLRPEWGWAVVGVLILLALVLVGGRFLSGDWWANLRAAHPRLVRGVGRVIAGARNGAGNLLWLLPLLLLGYVLLAPLVGLVGLWLGRRFLVASRVHGEDLSPGSRDASIPRPWKEPSPGATPAEPAWMQAIETARARRSNARPVRGDGASWQILERETWSRTRIASRGRFAFPRWRFDRH